MSNKTEKKDKYLIGLDVGTSSIKGILASAGGRILSIVKKDTKMLIPGPWLKEIDPEAHYSLLCDVIKELSDVVDDKESIAALCMAAASGNALMLDNSGKPLINITSWMDQRAAGKREETLPGLNFDEHIKVSGWPWNDSFPFAIYAWYKKYKPELFNKANYFCMNSDYLYYRLTGRKGVDPSTGATSFLFNQAEGKWHKPYLERLSIQEDQLAGLFNTGDILGQLTPAAAADCGLTEKTAAVLGSFDHPSAARAMGVFEPGDMLLSCGTSWVGLYPVSGRSLPVEKGLLTDSFLSPEGPWAGMVSIPFIGQTVDWYINNVIVAPEDDKNRKYSIFSDSAKSSPPGANGLFLSPFYDLEKNKPFDSTVFSSEYTRQDVARAVMEGIAFEMRSMIDLCSDSGIRAEKIVMVGGPSESDIWPRILSAITGLTLTLPENGQIAGALGAAMVAGTGVGIYKDIKEGFGFIGGGVETISPDKALSDKYSILYRSYLERKEKK